MVPRWSIGDRMRKARIHAGMTTDDMAADIGRTRRTISNYESGSTEAPLLVLRQYALRTGVPLDWIVRGWDSDDDGGGNADTRPHNLGYIRSVQHLAAKHLVAA